MLVCFYKSLSGLISAAVLTILTNCIAAQRLIESYCVLKGKRHLIRHYHLLLLIIIGIPPLMFGMSKNALDNKNLILPICSSEFIVGFDNVVFSTFLLIPSIVLPLAGIILSDVLNRKMARTFRNRPLNDRDVLKHSRNATRALIPIIATYPISICFAVIGPLLSVTIFRQDYVLRELFGSELVKFGSSFLFEALFKMCFVF